MRACERAYLLITSYSSYHSPRLTTHAVKQENIAIHYVLLFLSGVYRPVIAAAAGFVRTLGFIAYVRGYNTGVPANRGQGMFGYLGLLVNLVLAIGMLYCVGGWVWVLCPVWVGGCVCVHVHVHAYVCKCVQACISVCTVRARLQHGCPCKPRPGRVWVPGSDCEPRPRRWYAVLCGWVGGCGCCALCVYVRACVGACVRV